MADIAIRAPATANVPRDYTIPGAQEILPKSVSATMDGTAAGTSWFPCLQVLEPGGSVMFSAVASSPLAVGASAAVSWFRGLSQTPSSSAILPGTAVNRSVTAQTISSATSTECIFDTVLFDDLGWFNPAAPTKLTVSIPGQYLLIYTNAWQYPGGSGFPIQTGILFGSPATRVLVSQQVSSTGGTPNATSGPAIVNAAAGDVFTLDLYQASGGNMLTWIAGSSGTDIQPFPTLSAIRIGDRV